MTCNQTYKLFHSKGNYKQNEKTAYELGEDICKWCNQQGLTFQNIQTAHTTQQQKRTQKWAEGLKRHFSKEDRPTDDQQTHEIMLSITNY